MYDIKKERMFLLRMCRNFIKYDDQQQILKEDKEDVSNKKDISVEEMFDDINIKRLYLLVSMSYKDYTYNHYKQRIISDRELFYQKDMAFIVRCFAIKSISFSNNYESIKYNDENALYENVKKNGFGNVVESMNDIIKKIPDDKNIEFKCYTILNEEYTNFNSTIKFEIKKAKRDEENNVSDREVNFDIATKSKLKVDFLQIIRVIYQMHENRNEESKDVKIFLLNYLKDPNHIKTTISDTQSNKLRSAIDSILKKSKESRAQQIKKIIQDNVVDDCTMNI